MSRLVVCGAINWDISCFVDHLPAPGEEVTIRTVTQVSGGTGGNVAVAAARILGAGQVALIGALGEDDIAHRQLSALDAEGVVTRGIHLLAGEESGQAHILIDQQGQNIVASQLGANARLRAQHLNNPSVRRLLQECDSMIFTDPPLEVAAELVSWARRRGIPALWDPGILTSHGWQPLELLAKQVDTLFLNEAEASALFGTAAPDAIIQRMANVQLPNQVVLKLGTEGAAMLQAATGLRFQVPPLPLKELGLNAINTVGCGDVFAGAFAAYRVLGKATRECLIMASVAAGLNATNPETRGCPDRPTLETVHQRSHNLGFAPREHKVSETG
ncbi:MAG: hypothetical protein KAW95_03760 [Dehalococcoidia bacterium]|nr:hypothetical protein [Dehalococcoidia bacterium]